MFGADVLFCDVVDEELAVGTDEVREHNSN
jgi:hypothetical protein